MVAWIYDLVIVMIQLTNNKGWNEYINVVVELTDNSKWKSTTEMPSYYNDWSTELCGPIMDCNMGLRTYIKT